MSKKNRVAQPKKTTFIYTSVCCGQPAHKPPVQRSKEDKAENKFSTCSLGHWKCSVCEKNCKVTRSKYKEDTNGTDAGTTNTGTAAN